MVTVSECKEALSGAFDEITSKMSNADKSYLRSILKFSDRVKRMPSSKLASLFHSFGASGVTSTRLTATSIVKKAKRRSKIFVQPEALKATEEQEWK